MTEQPILPTSITAATDIVGRRFVDFDGNHANNESAAGVSTFGVKAGEQVPIVCIGLVVVECGGTVTKGGLVKADSVGKAIDLAGVGTPLGRAYDAGSNGSFVRVLYGCFAPVVV